MGALQMRPYQQAAREGDPCRVERWTAPHIAGAAHRHGQDHRICSGDGGPGAQREPRRLVLAHRGELLEQAADKIKRSTGLASAVEKAEQTCLDSWCRVVVGSVQSLQRPARPEQFPADYFGTIIIDEAHHAITDGYQRVLEHFPEANVLGVTATPDRGDMRNLGGGARFPRLRIQTYAGDPRGVPVPDPGPNHSAAAGRQPGRAQRRRFRSGRARHCAGPVSGANRGRDADGMRGREKPLYSCRFYQNEPEVPGHPQQQGVSCGRGKRAEARTGQKFCPIFQTANTMSCATACC